MYERGISEIKGYTYAYTKQLRYINSTLTVILGLREGRADGKSVGSFDGKEVGTKVGCV